MKTLKEIKNEILEKLENSSEAKETIINVFEKAEMEEFEEKLKDAIEETLTYDFYELESAVQAYREDNSRLKFFKYLYLRNSLVNVIDEHWDKCDLIIQRLCEAYDAKSKEIEEEKKKETEETESNEEESNEEE